MLRGHYLEPAATPPHALLSTSPSRDSSPSAPQCSLVFGRGWNHGLPHSTPWGSPTRYALRLLQSLSTSAGGTEAESAPETGSLPSLGRFQQAVAGPLTSAGSLSHRPHVWVLGSLKALGTELGMSLAGSLLEGVGHGQAEA